MRHYLIHFLNPLKKPRAKWSLLKIMRQSMQLVQLVLLTLAIRPRPSSSTTFDEGYIYATLQDHMLQDFPTLPQIQADIKH